MMGSARAAVIAILALLASRGALAQGWGGSLLLASDYMLRGVSQTAGKPTLQADFHYAGADRWFAGATGANVRRGGDDAAEIAAYAGYEWLADPAWRLRLTAQHYAYPGAKPDNAFDYDELASTVGFLDRAFVTISASPDAPADDGRHTALSYEFALHWPLPLALAANAGVGRYDRRGDYATRYLYWNAGLAWSHGPLLLDLSFIGAGDHAQPAYDEDADSRLVGTVTWGF
jgi:uncharacterized protein (TIGR02001 family)